MKKRYKCTERKFLSQVIRENITAYHCEASLKKEGLAGILAVLLGGIPDATFNILLTKNIYEFANTPELIKLPGISKKKALRLLAAIELAKKFTEVPPQKTFIKKPEDVVKLVASEMQFLDRECFQVLYLNTKNRLIDRETISIGTLNNTLVHPREVFKNAIRFSAASIILVHNHPSGDPTPSKEDIKVTAQVKSAGEILGIKVLDHLVVCNSQSYTSILNHDPIL